MSNKFIQELVFPVWEDVYSGGKRQQKQDQQGCFLYSMTTEHTKFAPRNVALFLPSDLGQINYNKALFECMVNMLKDCAYSLTLSPDLRHIHSQELSENVSEQGIHISMVEQLRQLSSTMQYIINCSSWREGKYHSFDKFEINRKIEFSKR